MYNLQTLKSINESYDREHLLSQEDVNIANAYSLLIISSRSKIAPKVGDYLLTKSGKYAHIDEVENEYFREGKISICENPYTPFISATVKDSNIKIKTNTSGGPWRSVNTDNIELAAATKEKMFCFFGHCGMRGNGAVDFQTFVNVWLEK